ncbi:MAG: MFS transporter [Planctomycetota bacterium]
MANDGARREASGLLASLGLNRPELRAWAMYDWANSAMMTTIVAAVFPVYFQRVAASGLDPTTAVQHYAVATTVSILLVAVLAPLLGAIADALPLKKKLLFLFMSIGVFSTALMFFVGHGNWVFALLLFVGSDVGACGSLIFYDALLRHIAGDEEIDRVSAAGYALGYIGGGVLLAANIAWIQFPSWFGLPSGENLSPFEATLPTRLAFLSVAIWWFVFSMPLFRKVPEPPAEHEELPLGTLLRSAGGRLLETFSQLRDHRQAILMLAAFLLYNDGIGTIIRLAVIYGAEVGIEGGSLIVSILVVQFVGIPFAFLFGAAGSRIGAKRAILFGIAVYLGIAVLAFQMKTATHFFVLAVLVGTVQGGTQALSRSLFASMIPKQKSTEFFALFSVSEKFAGILGPALFALIVHQTGSSRYGILSVISFFILGGGLLFFVNVDEGRRSAKPST